MPLPSSSPRQDRGSPYKVRSDKTNNDSAFFSGSHASLKLSITDETMYSSDSAVATARYNNPTPLKSPGVRAKPQAALSKGAIEALEDRDTAMQYSGVAIVKDFPSSPHVDDYKEIDYKTLLKACLKIFRKSFPTEPNFDCALFEKIHNSKILCFKSHERRLKNFSKELHNLCMTPICFLGESSSLIIALARQVRSDSLDWGTAIGPATNGSRNDHCVVVVEKIQQNAKQEWRKLYCTSIAKHKAQVVIPEFNPNSSCSKGDFTDKVEPFAQAVMYAAGMVLPLLARMQLRTKAIPITVVSCLKGNSKANRVQQSLRGHLHVPKACSDAFTCQITQTATGAENAAKMYLSAIFEGIKLAHEFAASSMTDEDQVIPLSGQTLDPRHCPNAVYANPFSSLKCIATAVQPSNCIRMNYGNIWMGNVTIGNVQNISGKYGLCTVLPSNQLGPADDLKVSVFVKVSSSLMHGWGTGLCFDALEKCSSILAKHTKLLFVARKTGGLMTVMEDLHELGYHTLAPQTLVKEKGVSMSNLWDGFTTLVNDVLLPMAKKRVIFMDLCAGYNVMGNVMFAQQDTKIRLDLINFDSVLPMGAYRPLVDKHHRYIDLDPLNQDAMVFVFIQVFLVGMSWSLKKGWKDVNDTAFSRTVCDSFESMDIYYPTKADVQTVLDYFVSTFASQSDTATRMERMNLQDRSFHGSNEEQAMSCDDLIQDFVKFFDNQKVNSKPAE